jgi:hydrogenase expression/formation protein HypC
MCLSLPAKVVEVIDAQSVRVDMGGSPRAVNTVMLDTQPELGQWLVVHAGFALGLLEPEEAESALALFEAATGDGQ